MQKQEQYWPRKGQTAQNRKKQSLAKGILTSYSLFRKKVENPRRMDLKRRKRKKLNMNMNMNMNMSMKVNMKRKRMKRKKMNMKVTMNMQMNMNMNVKMNMKRKRMKMPKGREMGKEAFKFTIKRK